MPITLKFILTWIFYFHRFQTPIPPSLLHHWRVRRGDQVHHPPPRPQLEPQALRRPQIPSKQQRRRQDEEDQDNLHPRTTGASGIGVRTPAVHGRPWAPVPGIHAQPVREPGEDLVPEPENQVAQAACRDAASQAGATERVRWFAERKWWRCWEREWCWPREPARSVAFADMGGLFRWQELKMARHGVSSCQSGVDLSPLQT